MKQLARAVLSLSMAALSLVALSSCGESPPPEGFEIRFRFVSVSPTVIEQLRITLEPADRQTFTMVEPMSYAGGAIDLEVATDGVLVLRVDGEYVAANSTPATGGSFIFPLEVWTADLQPRPIAPGVRVVAVRAGEPIAEGFLFLPEWPPPLGGNTQIQVSCLAAAANMGRCQP